MYDKNFLAHLVKQHNITLADDELSIPASVSRLDRTVIDTVKKDLVAFLREQESEQAERRAAFEQARATGKPVCFKQYVVDCCSRRLECSSDIISVYAMPDGSEKKERTHTY